MLSKNVALFCLNTHNNKVYTSGNQRITDSSKVRRQAKIIPKKFGAKGLSAYLCRKNNYNSTIMNKKIIIGILSIPLLISCNQETDFAYSCNETINKWAENNLSSIQNMSKKDWDVLPENKKTAAYRAFTFNQSNQKYNFCGIGWECEKTKCQTSSVGCGVFLSSSCNGECK